MITGGSRGIGFETARQLGHSGATVIITGRTEESVAAAAEKLISERLSVEPEVVDVTSYADVQRLADTVANRFERLDALVNNAGVAAEWIYPDPDGYVDPRAARVTLETNVLGVFHMVEAFLPLLRRSPAGRIVNVSSFTGSLTLQAQAQQGDLIVPAYQASKAAVNSITLTLSTMLRDSPIRVVSVDPGFVQTDFSPINRTQAPLTAAQGAQPITRAATGDLLPGTFVSHNAAVVPW
nr:MULTISPECIES: SDR family NAD(P)-dependent oxidoreductase [unclassified Mycolicibacterium]